jgi:hypothetical protein
MRHFIIEQVSMRRCDFKEMAVWGLQGRMDGGGCDRE